MAYQQRINIVAKITKGASLQEIKKSFRELSKTLHPDKIGEQGTIKYRQIIQAYEVLSDADLLQAYHDYLDNPNRSEFQHHFQYYQRVYQLQSNPNIVITLRQQIYPQFNILYKSSPKQQFMKDRQYQTQLFSFDSTFIKDLPLQQNRILILHYNQNYFNSTHLGLIIRKKDMKQLQYELKYMQEEIIQMQKSQDMQKHLCIRQYNK
ncbi:hypothetical protein pb186bvf_011689 [Paramecium bursaria]